MSFGEYTTNAGTGKHVISCLLLMKFYFVLRSTYFCMLEVANYIFSLEGVMVLKRIFFRENY